MNQLNEKDLEMVSGGYGTAGEAKTITVKGNLGNIAEETLKAIKRVLLLHNIDSSSQQDNQIILNKLVAAVASAGQSGEDSNTVYTAHVTFLSDGHIEDIRLVKS